MREIVVTDALLDELRKRYIDSEQPMFEVEMAGPTTTAPTKWALYVMEQANFVPPLVQALEKARARIKELEKRVGH